MPRLTYGLPPAHAALLFDALAHESRVEMLLLLAARGEASAGDLQAATGLGQVSASYHLRVLRGAGVVVCRREGRHTFYRLASPAAADVLRLVCGA
jgi:DNA-binding transcriptional ArsR family regulator